MPWSTEKQEEKWKILTKEEKQRILKNAGIDDRWIKYVLEKNYNVDKIIDVNIIKSDIRFIMDIGVM